MKKLICLCLALAAAFALAASGCQVDKTIGPTEPTTIPVNEDDLNNAAGLFDEDLDEAAREALRRALEGGLNIADLQAPTQPPETMPPTMPAGVETDAAEARRLMKDVLEIFGSGKFMMKTRSAAPFMEGGNIATPLTVAVDENVMAFEMEMDWASMFKGQGQSPASARIQGASAQTMFGKKMRFITRTDGMAIVFPDKKMYIPMGDGSEEGGELMDFDLTAALGEAFGGASTPGEVEEKLKDIKSSKVTANGKEYLSAEVATKNADGSTTTIRYYFLGGELKRIEAYPDAESIMWEVDMLTTQVPANFFSTQGMRVMDIAQMAELGGGIGDLLGGPIATTAPVG